MAQSGDSKNKKRKCEKFTLSVKLRCKLRHPREGIIGTAKNLARMQSLQMDPAVPMRYKIIFYQIVTNRSSSFN